METITFTQSDYNDNYNAFQLSLPLDLGLKIDPDDEVVFAVLLSGTILKYSQSIKFRLLAAIVGVITIHIVGFIYCIILAIFRVIDFGLIFPIASAMSGKFFYDVIFSSIALMIAPYIKNIFWICMKPKPTVNKPKKPKKSQRKKLNNQLSH